MGTVVYFQWIYVMATPTGSCHDRSQASEQRLISPTNSVMHMSIVMRHNDSENVHVRAPIQSRFDSGTVENPAGYLSSSDH